MSTLTVTIANTSYYVDSFSLDDQIEQASQCSFAVCDQNDEYTFIKGQSVIITDSSEGNIFTGRIHSSKREKGDSAGSFIKHIIECVGLHALADAQSSDKEYSNQYAGIALVDQIEKLRYQGITANYAMDRDETLADFTAGTLSNCIATANVGDGCLELAPAGVSITVTETTTADFTAGSLTNCTAASDTLAPTATSTIKFVATESLTYDSNAYIYCKIYDDGGLITIISGRYLEYDIWIDDASPKISAGVDIIFTDGTTLRDTALTDYRYYDDQHIRSHPGEDQSGFANGKWRHRKFWLESFVGKTISHVDIAIEGNEVGTYTAYFKNILETNGSGTTINTFFNGTLNTQKQMQNSGYSNISLSIVDTYDCGASSQRVSTSTNVSVVDILKSSVISWDATEPENTSVQIEYSLDGGNSYTICTNGAELPNLPAGLDLGSKSIQFRQTFLQLDGASPESKPILNDMTCTLNTSYVATKSDVTVSACTAGEWATGTLTNTQTSSGILQLTGYVREWSDADLSNMTIYGGGAGGTGPTTVAQHCNRGVVWVGLAVLLEGRSRLDFAGQWANGIVEVDVYIDVTVAKPGIVYRTTGWSNYDANYAYAVELTTTSVAIQRGSNSSAGSPGTRTEVASASLSLSSAAWHRLKVVFSGSSHTIYLDDVQVLTGTDGTYTAAGYIGLRATNSSASAGYQGQFNNFGVCGTGLSGTWLSASQSLTAAGTYGGSVVSWQDVSTNTEDTTLLVESTVNGGSSYQTVTNGGSIQNLTLGQSLSGVSVQFRITLTTVSASSLPQIQFFVARVLGGFSSSGTRISPALLLTNAGRVGDTLVAWNATTPAGTTLTIATSPTGTGSWTDRSSGDEIAGITSQPALVLDTFDTNTIANYTSTYIWSVATWTYDTVNSRITGSSGDDGIFRYDGLSIADAYVEADLDQADNSGLVCRMVDTNNMYALFLFDSQAVTYGYQNYFILSAIHGAGPTYTTIASGAVTFTRGKYYKFRLSCVGTTISVLKDGEQIASVTDSYVSSAGKSGLIASALLRCYNLRIHGYGDDLTGINSYTRATLTSTDPTATPQLLDLVLAALSPNIGIGSLITADYQQKYISDNISDLAQRSDYVLNIPANGEIFFNERETTPSPWYLSDEDTLIQNLTVEESADRYRNRQTLTGVIDSDGTTTYVTRDNTGQFANTISQQDYIDQAGISIPTPTIMNHASAAHTSSSDSGDLDVSLCESIDIDVDITIVSGTAPTIQFFLDRKGADGIYYTIWQSVTISSTRQLSTSVGAMCAINQSIGSLARLRWTISGSTPSFTFSASILGHLDVQAAGIGIIEAIEDVSSQNLSIADANTLADSRLQEYGAIGKTVKFETKRVGLASGQAIPATITTHKIYDVLLLITSVSRTAYSGTSGDVYYEFGITAVEGPALDTWRRAMNRNVQGG